MKSLFELAINQLEPKYLTLLPDHISEVVLDKWRDEHKSKLNIVECLDPLAYYLNKAIRDGYFVKPLYGTTDSFVIDDDETKKRMVCAGIISTRLDETETEIKTVFQFNVGGGYMTTVRLEPKHFLKKGSMRHFLCNDYHYYR